MDYRKIVDFFTSYRGKILASLIAAFFLSRIGYDYLVLGKRYSLSPLLSASKDYLSTAKNTLGNIFSTNIFPDMTTGPVSRQPTNIPGGSVEFPSGTVPSGQINPSLSPTGSPITPFPSTVFPSSYITPTGVYSPTNTPKPTKVPKATNTPKPTPIVLANRRPGNNVDEVIENVYKIICVPKPMLRAVLEIEYGPWLGKLQNEWEQRNTLTCPPAGCDQSNPVCNGDQTISGVMQMMSDTWCRIYPYVRQKVGNSVLSINVTYDAILGAGYHLKNISLNRDKDCEDWDLKSIAKAACKYGGSCGGGDNYCGRVCAYYNQFTTGPKKNCAQLPNVISMDGLCQLK